MKLRKISIESGFTLVELMVSLVVSMLVMAGVYSTYLMQRKTATAQDQVVETQQNIRAGMMVMGQEVKMAGYYPWLKSKDTSCGPQEGPELSMTVGVHTATSTSFGFSMDLDSNGNCSGTGENVTYNLYTDVDGISKLGRKSPVANEAVAENIERMEFFYLLEDGTATVAPAAAQLASIRSVTVSILARTNHADSKFINNTVYTPASGADWAINGKAAGTPPGDGYRRRMLVSNIQCRNMGY